MMRLQLRGSSRSKKIELDGSSSFGVLLEVAKKELELPAQTTLELLVGFPPKPCAPSSASSPLSAFLRTGETITVRVRQNAAPPAKVEPQSNPEPKRFQKGQRAMYTKFGRQMCTIVKVVPGTRMDYSDTDYVVHIDGTPKDAEKGTVSKYLEAESSEWIALRRVVPDDNSCLFNALSYLLENGSISAAKEMRETVASLVLSDPRTYPPEVLDNKTAEEYAQFIMNPDKWGGAIELAALSSVYKCEIEAIDVETLVPYIYGEGRDYGQRIFLLYTGIHYDALVANPKLEGSKKVNDVTLFKQKTFDGSPGVGEMHEMAMHLANSVRAAGGYTNVNSFSLRCTLCHKGLKGTKDATEHARQSGHQSFEEYNKA